MLLWKGFHESMGDIRSRRSTVASMTFESCGKLMRGWIKQCEARTCAGRLRSEVSTMLLRDANSPRGEIILVDYPRPSPLIWILNQQNKRRSLPRCEWCGYENLACKTSRVSSEFPQGGGRSYLRNWSKELTLGLDFVPASCKGSAGPFDLNACMLV